MLEIINTILPYISPSSLPLIVVILGGMFIYKKIGNDRAKTKEQRDKDNQELHDIVQKHTWEINKLKLENQHKDTLLDDLRIQCNELNTNLALVSQKLDTLVEAIKELKNNYCK